ncbi:MAG: hypothetical protein LBV42_02900 [Methanobrevibacter sp.]|jgi:hypothetical protein|nr:hypothetical protein [Methanobrevibacter sp.]
MYGFDGNYYLSKYGDVKDSGMDPSVHYIKYGKAEGRYANQILDDDKFDREYYLNKNGDVKDSGMDPSVHYIKYGKAEGRLPHA